VATDLNEAGFRRLLATVADGWHAGDARRAADCFTEDAVYAEPPDRQLYRGREELFRFFGGAQPPPMTMRWHHVVFDDDRQVGVGEYTFQGRRRYHGLVIVKVENGKIARWREYQYESDLDWEAFAGDSGF
jgi:ketosteroid isomerase-like protein